MSGVRSRRRGGSSPGPKASGGRDGAASASEERGAVPEVGMADVRPVNDPCSGHCLASIVFAIATCLFTAAAIVVTVRDPETQRLLYLDALGSVAFVSVLVAFSMAMCCVCTCFAGRPRTPEKQQLGAVGDVEAYARNGVGGTEGLDATGLYLDLMKRTVSNLIYQDQPMWIYDHNKKPQLVRGFSLERRVRGEDWPIQAHTMVGMRRLNNIQFLIEDIAKNDVPGDIIETGVLRGGSCIFMKACVRALGIEEGRRVIACDTFQPVPAKPTGLLAAIALPILRAVGSVPHPGFNRAVMTFLDGLPNPARSFPVMENPSDATVQIGMFLMRSLGTLPDQAGTSLAEVKDHFARYGLLDEGVQFLQGFFSDTLPTADIDQLSLIRLDGDTYESTITAIEPLYHKLSPGGYVIVDDYHGFDECRRAIDEYRAKHGVTEPLVRIDNLAVYWQKSH